MTIKPKSIGQMHCTFSKKCDDSFYSQKVTNDWPAKTPVILWSVLNLTEQSDRALLNLLKVNNGIVHCQLIEFWKLYLTEGCIWPTTIKPPSGRTHKEIVVVDGEPGIKIRLWGGYTWSHRHVSQLVTAGHIGAYIIGLQGSHLGRYLGPDGKTDGRSPLIV